MQKLHAAIRTAKLNAVKIPFTVPIPEVGKGTGMLGKLFARESHYDLEEQAYHRLFKRGFRPLTIVDVGACEGNWTRMARRVFPDAASLMIEPLASKASLLEDLAASLPDSRFESALLASAPGEEVSFYEMGSGSSMLAERSNAIRSETRLVTKTLDQLAGDCAGPIFLKIDTQGAELLVLAGGARTIERCDFIQLEVALLCYNEGAPTFRDVIGFMDGIGFVPYDFSGASRPNGVDLVQVDILFARKDSPYRPRFFKF